MEGERTSDMPWARSLSTVAAEKGYSGSVGAVGGVGAAKATTVRCSSVKIVGRSMVGCWMGGVFF